VLSQRPSAGRPQSRGIIKKSFEEPSSRLEAFQSWGQFVADLMIRIGEVIDDDEDRLRRIAALVGFRHVEELIEFLPRPDRYDGGEEDVVRRKRQWFASPGL
jgi:hypothetical protein